MAEWFRGAYSVPIIISGKSQSWVLAVGGKTVKGKVLHINQSHPQALPNYQMKHYRSLFNQPKPPGALPKVSEQHLKKPKNVKISNGRTAAATYGTFMRARKCLDMLQE